MMDKCCREGGVVGHDGLLSVFLHSSDKGSLLGIPRGYTLRHEFHLAI